MRPVCDREATRGTLPSRTHMHAHCTSRVAYDTHTGTHTRTQTRTHTHTYPACARFNSRQECNKPACPCPAPLPPSGVNMTGPARRLLCVLTLPALPPGSCDGRCPCVPDIDDICVRVRVRVCACACACVCRMPRGWCNTGRAAACRRSTRRVESTRHSSCSRC